MRLAWSAVWAVSLLLAVLHCGCRWHYGLDGLPVGLRCVEVEGLGPQRAWPREGSQVSEDPHRAFMPDWREKYSQIDMRFEARIKKTEHKVAAFVTFDCVFINAGMHRVRLDLPSRRYGPILYARQLDDKGMQQPSVKRLGSIDITSGRIAIGPTELVLGPGETHSFQHDTQFLLEPGRYLVRLSYGSLGRPHRDAIGWQGTLFSNATEVEILPRQPSR